MFLRQGTKSQDPNINCITILDVDDNDDAVVHGGGALNWAKVTKRMSESTSTRICLTGNDSSPIRIVFDPPKWVASTTQQLL